MVKQDAKGGTWVSCWRLLRSLLSLFWKGLSAFLPVSSQPQLYQRCWWCVAWWRANPSRWLELGSFVLFAALAVYATLLHPAWSVIAVRLRVDAGLLLIVLLSIAIRWPFTLQYAREKVPAELWQSPGFIRINYVITAVWALAFAVITAVEAAILYVPSISQKAGVWIAILVIYGAFRFTEEYPKRQQSPVG